MRLSYSTPATAQLEKIHVIEEGQNAFLGAAYSR
jgi:hypothetical protein